jgi:ubiquinone/menaquinone biosynthesis C-methylase UbiE
MGFSTYFSKQAKKPSGIFGRLFMSRIFDKGNLELNNFVKETLAIKKSDHVLEIGCGTGSLLKRIANELENGVVEGVDFSKTMISLAKKKNKRHVLKKKAIIRLGNFDELQFENNSYDKIFSVNTIYFWKNPVSTISKASDLLKANGTIVLGFHSKDEMERMDLDENIFQLYSLQDVRNLLKTDEILKEVEIISKKGQDKVNYCAIGIKGNQEGRL